MKDHSDFQLVRWLGLRCTERRFFAKIKIKKYQTVQRDTFFNVTNTAPEGDFAVPLFHLTALCARQRHCIVFGMAPPILRFQKC